MTIATAGSLFTFNLEWILHKTFHQRLTRDAEDGVKAVESLDAEAPLPAAKTDSNDLAKLADHKVRLRAIQNVVVSYTFEAGIIFHSE